MEDRSFYIKQHLLGCCESPIEEQFIEAWIDLLDLSESSILTTGSNTLAEFTAISKYTPFTLLHNTQIDFVFSQVEIPPFRADFVLGRVALEVISNRLFRLPLVVVECDGHDFHEKTKDQASRDKRRDRKFTIDGFRVIRFTGSEIYRSPFNCAKEVDHLFSSMMDEESNSFIEEYKGKKLRSEILQEASNGPEMAARHDPNQ